jgi:Ca-activated chloride channel homolog
MQLYSPWILLLLLVLPLMAYMQMLKKGAAAIKFPTLLDMKNCMVSWRIRLRPLLLTARLLCIALLIFALARPRKGTVLSEISTQGIAIEVIADRSGSMQSEMDYYGQKLNRLEVVKNVIADFIKGDDKKLKGRDSDLIGLVTFARYADTLCPLVLSHNVLLEFLNNTDFASRDEDGTAIGDAIALASARLKKAEDELKQRNEQLAKDQKIEKLSDNFKIASKVIILLTDGNNNAGEKDPLEAAKLAKQWGIKVYTIGIGSDQAYTTIQTPLGNYKMPTGQDLDEGLLKVIAEDTGCFYGRADSAKTLENIIEKIDKMEKSNVKSVQYTQYAELFGPWTLAALCILICEVAASCTIFRKIP